MMTIEDRTIMYVCICTSTYEIPLAYVCVCV